jgi:hypothetical protein
MDLGKASILVKVNNALLYTIKEHLSPNDVNLVSIYKDLTLPQGPVIIILSLLFGMSYKPIDMQQIFGELKFIGL